MEEKQGKWSDNVDRAPALCERLDRVQAAHKPAKPRKA